MYYYGTLYRFIFDYFKGGGFLLSCRLLTRKRLPITADLNSYYYFELGGSLYNVLEEPEYIYGLKETDLKQLIKDVTSGMSYLREKVSQT